MAKQKQSKEEQLTELSGWTKTEKANKVLDELKAKSRKGFQNMKEKKKS